MQWYHARCQNISSPQYAVYAGLESFSWLCLRCGSPNYSSGCVESLSSLPVSNHFSALELSDSFEDLAYCRTTIEDTSVPLSPHSNVFNPAANDNYIPFTSTPIKHVAETKNSNIHLYSKLKVICINCQSIQSTEKRARFYTFLDIHKPDIVVGTESWLHKDIPDCEVFPSSLGYNPPIRRDRPSDTKGGGVFILVSQRLVVSEQPQLSTDCEIVWAKVQVVGAKPLLIAAHYRPTELDQVSAEELKKSLALIDPSKSHVWVLGDFNYPKMNWEESQPILKQNCPSPEMYQDFISTINDSCLTQVVCEPTRESNILDLFLTNNPTLVDSVNVVPGIADHQAVVAVVRLRPSVQKVKPRTVHLYSKANWNIMRQEMHDFQSTFLSTCEGKSTEELWQEFKGKVEHLINRYVPTKTLRGRKNLPWITQGIRRKMNKRDHLYQVQKASGKDSDRELFKKVKYEVDSMIKTSYNNYLDSLVGIIDDSPCTDGPRPNTKKLYSYLKNCRQESQGSSPLKQDEQLRTDNVQKANLLNEQFQSVFTPKSPLMLKQLCSQKVQDLQESGHYSSESIPTEARNTYHKMQDIDISVNGIIKLLQGLKPDKAPGPDCIKPLLLQKLSSEIAPILQV
ncbi:MAG: hypothetical protein AB2693_21280, partial [Candidatus Thiodiazotropha sp.]